MTNLVDEARQRFEDSDPQLPFDERWRIALQPLVTTNAVLKAEVAGLKRKLHILEGGNDPEIQKAAGKPCDLLEVASGLHEARTSQGEQER